MRRLTGQHPARERRPSAPLALSWGLLQVPEPPRGGAELRCPPSLPEAPALARHSDVHRLSDSVPVPGHAPGAGPSSQRLPPGPAPAQVPLATCVGSRGGAGRGGGSWERGHRSGGSHTSFRTLSSSSPFLIIY